MSDPRGRLTGAHAVVTGASSGIGRAIAERLAGEGANVLLTYRASASEAEAAVGAIRDRGGRADSAQADLSTVDGCQALVAERVSACAASSPGSTTRAPTS